MIAADTSSFRRYSTGERGHDVNAVEAALASESLYFPAVVVTELLSDPRADKRIVAIIEKIPLLEISVGYWARAGALRATLLEAGLQATVSDTLLAQSCIDHDVPLITHDRDFRHFVKAGLKLL
ncbi:MAG TPA: PIN domain-containing protein [Thermoanaerobaculia bacterium]|nr:PIN domain-containing protein [Thermoanaerobaculia bacterium]